MVKLGFIVALALSPSLFSELVISRLAYDKTTDEVVVTAQFPGKCLPHELRLDKTKIKGQTTSYRLTVSNSDNDPCNALNEKTARFSLADITVRPAEILVSTHRDGAKPHALPIVEHPRADILKVSNENSGDLRVTVRFRGPDEPGRFYLDVDWTCALKGEQTCEGIVRDKRGLQFVEQPLHSKTVQLTSSAIPRPQNLVFHRADKKQSVRFYLP